MLVAYCVPGVRSTVVSKADRGDKFEEIKEEGLRTPGLGNPGKHYLNLEVTAKTELVSDAG